MAPKKDQAGADDFEDDVASTVAPGSQSTSDFPPGQKPNAFTELMKAKPPPKEPEKSSQRTIFVGRDGLAAYTVDPASFPKDRVVHYDDKFVVIRDMFPKATIHLLILPRDMDKSVQRGQTAFDDSRFLSECKQKEKEVRGWVAEELRNRYGASSAAEKPRREAMMADELPDELPPGRDWEKEVISGIHAVPSMNHLHIHVLSRDMRSDWLKKHNHYLSFTTDFLIPLSAFPLPHGDYRRRFGHWTDDEMKCWRCGKNFGSGAPGVRKLKPHLDAEFEEWKRE